MTKPIDRDPIYQRTDFIGTLVCVGVQNVAGAATVTWQLIAGRPSNIQFIGRS